MHLLPLREYGDGVFPRSERAHTLLHCNDDDDASSWFDALEVRDKVDKRGQSRGKIIDVDCNMGLRPLPNSTPCYILLDFNQVDDLFLAQARALGKHIVVSLPATKSGSLTLEEYTELKASCINVGITPNNPVYNVLLTVKCSENSIYLRGDLMRPDKHPWFQ